MQVCADDETATNCICEHDLEFYFGVDKVPVSRELICSAHTSIAKFPRAATHAE
jgi:hypothetical protein